MKSGLKKILVGILGCQVRRLRKQNDFKIIGVVGSIGKTSTKLAIAKFLASHYRVKYQEGNYNDIVSVPLVFFGQAMPRLWNIFAWIKIILQNEIQILLAYPFDFVVLELGTDAPGQIAQFRKYLHLDIAVLTAVTPEHMEFFRSLEKVAEEEWSVSFFSDLVFVNRDLCKTVPENIDHQKVVFYGKDFGSVYKIENIERVCDDFDFEIYNLDKKMMNIRYTGLSEVELYSVAVASALSFHFGVPVEKIKDSAKKLLSFAGRMQRLVGVKKSIIIDDSYNASPLAVKMALDALYAFANTNRIAILGMMNELGDSSREEHEKIGQYCDPKLLSLVVTIGNDANLFLAKEAKKRGCEVYESRDAQDAGNFVLNRIKEDTVILVKGSQNGVFAEEAIKPLLKDESDYSKLVRQSKDWLKKKQVDF